MTNVEEAERIIQLRIKNYGKESIAFDTALSRVLAKDILADKDIPAFNRVTMDGVAIRFKAFEQGIKTFKIKGTQAAGDAPLIIETLDECIEIMTGCALPATTDTVIRYEDLVLEDGLANVLENNIKKGQNIHYKGKDRKEGDTVAKAGEIVTPALINIAASVGANKLSVKKLPKVVVISTGDELIEVQEIPTPYQIRQSNNYTIKAVLNEHCIEADLLHIPDDMAITKLKLEKCLKEYDAVILSGGISMGKFDYVPKVLAELAVEQLFHKVKQKPGKPFWFGEAQNGVFVFAFPGNPVSMFMCLHRYFIPWLRASLGLEAKHYYAVLDADFTFAPSLQYFLQVRLSINDTAQLIATPVEGNGSGDFANLLASNAFIELPAERDNFTRGEVFRVWPFKEIL
jgi:molybdopterin molybdotransferase